MAVEPTGLLTYEDYVAFPDDGIRREIVGGEVFELSAPTTRHQRLVLRLAFVLEEHVRRHGSGEVFVSPIDVLLGLHDIVQPDVVCVDPDADRVEVYRLTGTTYGKPTILEPGETLTTPLLPGLEIDLDGLLAR